MTTHQQDTLDTPTADLLDALQMREAYEQGRTLLTRLAAFEAESSTRLDELADEFRRKLWRSQGKQRAIEQARQQQALRAKDAEGYVAANGSQHDLPLDLCPILRDGAELSSGADMLALLKFFNEPQEKKSGGPAFWTVSVLREAELHLYDILAADLRRQLRATWQPLLDALRYPAAKSLDPFRSYEAYLLRLDMLFELGELSSFEVVYDEFRRCSGEGYSLFPWLGGLLHDDAFRTRFAPALMRLLDQAITIRQLRHQAGDHMLSYLQILRKDLQTRLVIVDIIGIGNQAGGVLSADEWDGGGALDKGPIAMGTVISAAPAVMPTPNTIGFKLPPKLDRVQDTLEQTLGALVGSSALHRRRSGVLSFWLAFLCRQRFDLQRSREVLKDLAGAEELPLLSLSLRGELAYFAGDLETAQMRFGSAIELGNRLLKTFQRVNGRDAAAIQAARQFLGHLHQWRGNTFVSLGDAAQAQSDYALVDEYLPASTPETRLTRALNQGNLAYLCNNLIDHRGYVTYNTEDMILLHDNDLTPFLRLKLGPNRVALDQADQQYRAAKALVPHLRKSERPRWQAIVDANLGNVAWARARLLAEVARLPQALRDDFVDLGTIGEQYRKARALYYAAYEVVSKLPGDDRLLAATCLASAGELDMLLGDYSAAESASFESLNLLGYGLRDDFDGLLDVDPDPHPEQTWRIYLTLARVYEARGTPQPAQDAAETRDKAELERQISSARSQRAQARRAYERALATVESLRGLIRNDDWQIATLQTKLQVYECAMHFYYTAPETPDAARIFELSEHMKGRAFLDLLESARLNFDSPALNGLCEQRAKLEAAYTDITQAMRLAGGDDEFEQLRAEAAQLEAKRRQILSELQAAQLAAVGEINPQPLTWKECHSFLKRQPETILLSFTIGEDHSYLLVADATAVEAFELPGRAAIETAASRLLWYTSIQKEAGAFEYAAANRAVVNLLLGPAIERAHLLERMQGKRIVILPDGMLFYLPFELLLVRQPAGKDGQPLDFEGYRQLDPVNKMVGAKALCRDLLPFYMLHLGPISYAQSASVWHKLQTAPAGQPDRTAMGVYNIRYSTKAPARPGYTHAQELNISFSDLSQTKRIAQVLDGFGGDPASIVRLSSEPTWPKQFQSTEDNFKRSLKLNRVRYVIFAGHGVYNDKYPQFSGIVFNTPSRRAHVRQDGFFGLGDIFDLCMPDTELVFLAACQGGIGVLSRGEGVNALTRAFMYRGSPSVIAGLWTVDVLATVKLVDLFFERLRAQPDADKASVLQQAKQALCNASEQFAHPYWWAAFVLMGRR